MPLRCGSAGDGVLRRLTFRAPMTVSTLSGHCRIPPGGVLALPLPGPLAAARPSARFSGEYHDLARTGAPCRAWRAKMISISQKSGYIHSACIQAGQGLGSPCTA